jgi:flagellar M-ring protein FliF
MAEQELLAPDARAPSALQSAHASKPFGLAAAQGFMKQPALLKSLPALGAVSMLALAAAAWWSFQTPAQRPLFEGLADADKSAVADALQSGGIAYSINSDTGGIQVGEDDVHRARILLAGQGLPKAAPGGDALISALPMGSSRAVEGETLRGAREADLARTIEAIDAVKSARIHLATPEPSIFVRDNVAPAASVMLTLQSGRMLSAAQVRAIKHLVASSVPSLSPEQVSVVDQTGQLLSQADANGDNAAFQLQLQMEDRYRQALVALLAPVIGQGNFTAELHVDIDQSESQSTRESYPKDDRALRTEEGNKTTSATSTPPAVGIPGALSNQPPQATTVATQPGGQQASPAPTAGESAETFTRSFDVGREISVTHQPVGKLRRLTVAVAIRDVKGAKPRTPAEMASLEALVKGAVGFDQARGDVVAISARPFVETEAAVENIWDAPWFMFAVRQVGALIVALLVLLFIGRPLVKALRARIAASQAAQIAADADRSAGSIAIRGTAAPTAATDPYAVTLEMIENAPSYAERATLVRGFVRQDPVRASMVVRQLMGDNASG